MVVVFVACACGICLVEEFHAAVYCLVMLTLLFSRRRLPFMAAGLVLGCTAAVLTPKTIWIEGEHALSGRVVSSDFAHGQYRVELSEIAIDGTKRRGRARLNLYPNTSRKNVDESQGPGIPVGRRVNARAILKPPHPFGNEGEFKYARYLRSEGITITGYIKGWDSIVIEKSAPGPMPHLRHYTQPASRMLSVLARPEAEVLTAMLWGDRSNLSSTMQDCFASLGLSHLIAISGLNIGLIVLFGYELAYTVLRCLPRLSERIDTPTVSKLAGLVCAVLFALIVEPSYPTTRSVLMAIIMITALVLARRTDLIDALALSGCLIMLLWPLSIFTSGFLLSYSAVLGLIVVLKRLEGRQLWLRSLAVPITASAFTMPIALYLYGFIAPLGILYNVVFVPMFSFLALPLGLAGWAASAISASTASLFFSWAMDIIALILWVGEHFGHLTPVAQLPLAWVYLCYLGLILSFFGSWREPDATQGTRLGTIVLGGICLTIMIIPLGQLYVRYTRPLTFDFISVGQGDSILITKGLRSVLIDAGGTLTGFDTGRFVVAPHLLRRGVTRLDLAIITHSHPDHAGGMPFILERFGVGQVWINALHDQHFKDVTRISASRSIPVHAVCKGERLKLNDIHIEVLHPQVRQEHVPGMDSNLQSMVVRIGDARMTGLFMADAHRYGELSLIHGEADVRADVLKVAHHGSARSCQEIFLDAVRPRVAVISCGYRNPYGMPAPEVLDRLRAKGIRMYRTDRNGEVQIIANHGRIDIKSMLYLAEKH